MIRVNLKTLSCLNCLVTFRRLLTKCGADDVDEAFPWSNLMNLHLNECNITALDDNLKLVPRLQVLNLSNNHISALSTSLQYLSSLQTLTLSHNTISNTSVFATHDVHMSLQRLTSLDLSFNTLTSLEGLQHLHQLRILNIAHNRISSPHGITHLSGLHMLSSLICEGNPLVDAAQYRLEVFCQLPLVYSSLTLNSLPASSVEAEQIKLRLKTGFANADQLDVSLLSAFSSFPAQTMASQGPIASNISFAPSECPACHSQTAYSDTPSKSTSSPSARRRLSSIDAINDDPLTPPTRRRESSVSTPKRKPNKVSKGKASSSVTPIRSRQVDIVDADTKTSPSTLLLSHPILAEQEVDVAYLHKLAELSGDHAPFIVSRHLASLSESYSATLTKQAPLADTGKEATSQRPEISSCADLVSVSGVCAADHESDVFDASAKTSPSRRSSIDPDAYSSLASLDIISKTSTTAIRLDDVSLKPSSAMLSMTAPSVADQSELQNTDVNTDTFQSPEFERKRRRPAAPTTTCESSTSGNNDVQVHMISRHSLCGNPLRMTSSSSTLLPPPELSLDSAAIQGSIPTNSTPFSTLRPTSSQYHHLVEETDFLTESVDKVTNCKTNLRLDNDFVVKIEFGRAAGVKLAQV
jgi:hypothetical protein